jgi:DNA-binding transcriptional LysR family regulator
LELELRHLQAFLAVVESGSLTEAARRLGMRQPTLTQTIQGLERSLGGVVFERSSQGMRPNALGRAIEARARVIAGEVGRVHRDIGELLSVQRGRVIIGGGPVFAHPAIRDAMAKFRKAHPKIEVEVNDVLIREVIPAVKAGEVDYAVANFGALDDDEVVREVLLPAQRVSLIASASNPLTRKRRVSLEELWPGPWLLPVQGRAFRAKLDEIFSAAKLPPPQAAIECNSIFLIKTYLEGSDLIAPLQDTIIGDELKRNILRTINVPEIDWKVDVGVVYRRGVPLPPAAGKLLDGIRGACAAFRRASRPLGKRRS